MKTISRIPARGVAEKPGAAGIQAEAERARSAH